MNNSWDIKALYLRKLDEIYYKRARTSQIYRYITDLLSNYAAWEAMENPYYFINYDEKRRFISKIKPKKGHKIDKNRVYTPEFDHQIHNLVKKHVEKTLSHKIRTKKRGKRYNYEYNRLVDELCRYQGRELHNFIIQWLDGWNTGHKYDCTLNDFLNIQDEMEEELLVLLTQFECQNRNTIFYLENKFKHGQVYRQFLSCREHWTYHDFDGLKHERTGYHDYNGNKIRYPLDPRGPPQSNKKCRCTYLYEDSPDYKKYFQNYNPRIDTSITLEFSTCIVDEMDMVTVTGKLISLETSNPLSNKKIRLKVGKDIMTTTTDNNGTFSSSYTAEKVGTFTVTASYAGNDIYNACSKTGSVTINKLTTTLTASSVSIKYGKAATVTGTLIDEKNNAVSGATISVVVNNGTSQTVTTDTSGAYSFTYTPTAVGTDTLTFDYTGGVIYEAAATATSTVTVTRLDTSLLVNDISNTKYAQTGTITGTLNDENSTAIASATVNAVISDSTGSTVGTTLTATTSTDGSFTFTIPATYDVGTYTVSVTFAQSSTGEAATVSKTWIVEKRDTEITIDPISAMKVGDTTLITGTLVDEFGEEISGETVTVEVEDGS